MSLDDSPHGLVEVGQRRAPARSGGSLAQRLLRPLAKERVVDLCASRYGGPNILRAATLDGTARASPCSPDTDQDPEITRRLLDE